MPQVTPSCRITRIRRPVRLAILLLLLGGSPALPPCLSAQSPEAKPPPPPARMPAIDAVEMFEPRDVQLSWQNRHWLLVHQGHTLKDFGPQYDEARQGLRLIHDLGLNQHGLIGSPTPLLEYWLVDGHAPAARMPGGLRTVPLDVAHLRVERVENQWCIRDTNRVLFTFAAHADEARRALAVLKKHQFAQVGIVGAVVPSMVVFLGGPEAMSSAPTLHASGLTNKPFGTTSFPTQAKGKDGNRTVTPTGYEGIVQPLVPPLSAPLKVHTTSQQEQLQLPNQGAVAWQTRPRFSPFQAPRAVVGDRVVFDWRQVQVHQDNGHCTLVAGSLVLAGFGFDVQAAQKALSVLRYYRFTEQHIGGSGAGGETGTLPYFLANGASPRGMMFGMQGEEIQPDQLEVQQHSNGYALCQGTRVILPFGDHPEPARQALEVIRRERLDRVCHLGRPGADGMTFLVRSR